MKKKTVLNFCLLGLLVILIAWFFAQGRGEVLWSAKQAEVESFGEFLRVEDKVASVADEQKFASAAAKILQELSSEAVIVMDKNTKQVLLAKNENAPLYPASTTKIMTALVTRERYDLNQTLTIGDADLTYGNNTGWQVGEVVKVEDLVKSLLIASANEAGLALANHSPQGYDDFVARMNQKAQELGLNQSSFANPQGFDDERQRTSARDLAILSLELLRDEVLAQIVATAQEQVTKQNGGQLQLVSTNQLFRQNLPYTIKGVKTGTTDLAHEALVSLIEKDGIELLVVVLSAKNRYNDTIDLADFAFDNYIWNHQKSFP